VVTGGGQSREYVGGWVVGRVRDFWETLILRIYEAVWGRALTAHYSHLFQLIHRQIFRHGLPTSI
jgi:hypothetical protein